MADKNTDFDLHLKGEAAARYFPPAEYHPDGWITLEVRDVHGSAWLFDDADIVARIDTRDGRAKAYMSPAQAAQMVEVLQAAISEAQAAPEVAA